MASFKKSYFSFLGIVVLVLYQSTMSRAELTSGMDADVVIGQPDFTTNTAVTTQRGMNSLQGKCLVVQNKLIVADQLNSRVLIWNTIPKSSYAPADVVLGQPDFTSSTANNGGRSASSFSSPNSLASDGQKLIVFDQNNFRALIWNQIPTANKAPADVVVGQPDFATGTSGLSSTKMNRARGVFCDGTRLFIADLPNNRVLIYNHIPLTNGMAADLVIGQPDFTTGTSATSTQMLNSPSAIAGDGKRLFICDGENSRILIYNTIPTKNFATADIVLGQTDFTTSATGGGPRKMSGPRDVYCDGKRLFVADTINNRVLVFNTIPTNNGAAADVVLGQPDFDTTSAGLSRNKIDAVRGLSSDGKNIFITETNNNRLLIFNLSGTTAVSSPQFNQGKGVLGKVFNDVNNNGTQDNAEKGLEGIKIASDTGIYAITDEDGKYHFPYIETGQHILKIDESTLPEGSVITTESPRKIVVTEGILTKISFGIKLPVVIPAKAGIRTDSVDSSFRGNDKGSPLLKTTLSQDPVLLKPALSIEAKIQDKDILFTIHTNYHLFIESSEITLYTKDLKPFKTIPLPNPIPYQYILKKEELLPNQETFYFQLSVKDKQGREDRTAPTQHM